MEDCDTMYLDHIFLHHYIKWQSHDSHRKVTSFIFIILVLFYTALILSCVSL